MERYIVNGRIGEGAHGIVLRGIDKSSMKVVAMKRIALKNINEQGLPSSAVRELLALRLIRHDYVANLVDYFSQGYSLVLVCEYLPIDLNEFLRSNVKPLAISHVKSCMSCESIVDNFGYFDHFSIQICGCWPALSNTSIASTSCIVI